MMNFIKTRWYFILIAITVIGFIFYRFINLQNASKNAKSYTVTKQNLKETLSLSGIIDADEKVKLKFDSAGKMVWVGVKEGDNVQKFQGIASLDQRELQKRLSKFLNTYMKSRWSFEQSKDDNSDQEIGGLTEKLRTKAKRLIDQAQFDLNNSVLDVEIQSLALESSFLSTPIEGIVTKVTSPFAGVNIIPNEAEFDVINPQTVFFSVFADQTEVVNIVDGKTGEIILDSYPDQKISGTVKNIAFTPKEDETGTVYVVKMSLEVDNSGYQYRLGMTGDATFTLKETGDVIAVPEEFIKTENGKKYVLKKEKNKKVKTFVQIGKTIDASAEITSGLKEGDVIYD